MMQLGRASEALSRPPATNEVKFAGYSVLSTPSKPDYTYGNLIVAHATPRPDELERLLELWWFHFEKTQCKRPVVAFEQVGTNLPKRYDAEASALSLELNLDDVFEFSKERAPVTEGSPTTIRPIREEGEWLQLKAASALEDDFGITDLQRWLLTERRQTIEAGNGAWWGAFGGPDLVGSCAAFWSDSFVRFEQLRVDHRHRRKGVGSLLMSVLGWTYCNKRIIIEAEYDSRLSTLYQRLGYVSVGLTFTFVGTNR